MKHLFSLLLLCSITFCVHSQVSKTVDVVKSGTLGTYFQNFESYTVTNLTVSGSIDARDFKFIRDSMLSVAVVDFADTQIKAYTGAGGTSPEDSIYPANEVPAYAFLKMLEYSNYSSYLKRVVVSKTATSIREAALAHCTGLDTIRISASIKTIGRQAFTGSSAVFSVDPENTRYTESLGMLFDKSLKVLYHCPISYRGDCVLPSSLDTVARNAFYGCTKLQSVELPKTLRSLGSSVFYNCTGMKALKVNTLPDSISLGERVFYSLEMDSCILYVPYGTSSDFRMAEQWDAFWNIQEHSTGLVTDKDRINLLNEASSETLFVRSNVNWTVQSDQSWLTTDKFSSSGLDTIVVSVAKNTTDKNRVAHLLITGDGLDPKIVTITQSAPELVVHIVSGGLANSLKTHDQRSLMMLKVNGTMDVRDFRTLNDSLPMLSSVDLSEVRVTAWQIKDGYSNFHRLYSANTIPEFTFNGLYSKYRPSINRIILPNSIQAIDPNTFQLCYELKELVIPDSVKTIGSQAFFLCYRMTNLVLGRSVNKIAYGAFMSCLHLKTIRVKSEIPIVISETDNVFKDLDVSACKLYVPYGTKKMYQAANFWKEFPSIVDETEGLYSETTSVKLPHMGGSTVKAKIETTTSWSTQSDQSWLSVNPVSGLGSDSITFIAEANASSVTRKAVVTVSTVQFGSRTITVTQSAAPKTIQVKAGELGKTLTAEEKKTVSNLILKGTLNGRDFLVMRDSMPLLNSLDISDVNIMKYVGSNATSVTNDANAIPTNAFITSSVDLEKEGLENIVLPLSITSIGEYAFKNCKNLRSIVIPENVNSIESEAFSGCILLTKVVLPNSLKLLESYVFYSCSSLTDISFGDSLNNIGRYAFFGCKALKQITFPESLLIFNDHAFSNCSGLTEVSISTNVSYIGSNVFQSCISLSRIVLNKNLQFIGSSAFGNCTKLTEIRIPGSVKWVEENAFSLCTSLKSVFVNAVNPLIFNLGANIFWGLDYSQCTLHVPFQSKSLYSTADQWNRFSTIQESPFGLTLNTNSVTLSEKEGSCTDISINSNTTWTVCSDQPWLKLEYEAGSGMDTLTVTAKENTGVGIRRAFVTLLAEGVEPQCVQVTQDASMKILTITAGSLSGALTTQEKLDLCKLTLIGSMDARDFKILRDLVPNLTILNIYETTILPYSGKDGTSGNYTQSYPANTIPANAFCISGSYNYLTLLQKVVLPASLLELGFEAFVNCSRLDSILIPNTVTKIGSAAFSDCTSLKSVVLGSGVKSIGFDAFYGCKSLTSMIIPNSVVTIDSDAFSSCTELTNLVIGSNVTTIGSGAFSRCPALTSVVIPNSVITINYGAFEYCNGLKSISIPASVTSISYWAFSCTGLENIYVYSPNPLSIRDINVFGSVNKETCILNVPVGSKNLYATSTVWKDFANIVEMETSLSVEGKSMLSIFPNPFNDVICLQGIVDGAQLTIMDMTGKVLISRRVFNNETLKVEDLTQGMYLVRLKTSKGIVTRKIVKE